MRFETPLDDIFLNRSHVRVLRALHRLPDGLAASGREVARRSGTTHPTALRALTILLETGLVRAVRSPNGDAYELDRDHVLSDRIAELYRTEAAVGQELESFLRDELLALSGKVEWATLFGSVAWGDSAPTSDIDLAVSCPDAEIVDIEKAIEALSDVAWRRFGNRVSPLINVRKQRPRSGIWKRIEKEGIPLIRSGEAVPS